MMVAEGRGLFCLYSKQSLEVANILSRRPSDTLRYNPLQCELLVQCMHVSQVSTIQLIEQTRILGLFAGEMTVREGKFYFCVLAHVRVTTGQILVGYFAHSSLYPKFNSINMSNAKLPSKCFTI